MANQQLVNYIREQLSHHMNESQLRLLLLQQGWSEQDIEAAFNQAYMTITKHNKEQHHTNFVALSITAIIVLSLIGALLIIVFKEQPGPSQPLPPPQPPPVQPPNQLTGWAVCAQKDDSLAKDLCYQQLNAENELFDCDVIENPDERSFCYRAKEAVLLKRYQEQGV